MIEPGDIMNLEIKTKNFLLKIYTYFTDKTYNFLVSEKSKLLEYDITECIIEKDIFKVNNIKIYGYKNNKIMFNLSFSINTHATYSLEELTRSDV